MKVFGLTGGIGMGKSTAARLLGERGLPVVDTDQLARDIVEPGQPALQEIQNVFGSHVIGADGHLRRSELAKIIFSDVAAREKLEHITHPRILALWKKQVARWREEKRSAAVVVIPLLFETKAETEFDAVICVACSAQAQGKRLAERNWTPEQIQQRLAAQWPVETKISRSHFVVWSEGNPEIMAEQLARIV
jgi:dephospho-CoA kinase